MGDKIKVTITYLDDKVVWSRYGYCRRVESVVRFMEEQDLEKVLSQFRAKHDIMEVKITR